MFNPLLGPWQSVDLSVMFVPLRPPRASQAPRRRRGAARPQHAARIRRGDLSWQAPRRVYRAHVGGVAAQVDARGRTRRRPRVRGLLDEAGVTGHHAREGHRPRVHKVTGRQRDIFGTLDVEWQCEGVQPVRSTSSGSVGGTATWP